MSIETTPDRTGVCSWCKHTNAPGSRFCGNCGRTLVFDVACPFCGCRNPEVHAYCDACGVLLDESKRKDPRETGIGHLARFQARVRDVTLDNWPILALVAIVALALSIRLFSLTDIPPNVVGDEADNLLIVYRIMADIGPGFFELDWKPQPAFSVYMMGWFMGLFGETIVGMRMSSVVLSTASVLVFYAVVRQHNVSRPAGLGAALLLATGVWYLHFSRSGWENVHVGLYTLSAMLSLNAAIGSKRLPASLLLFAATGLFAALGLYGYTSGRVIIVALLAYLPIAFFLHSEHRKRLLIGYGVMCITALVLFWPQLDNALDDWENFNRRVQVVYVLNEENSRMFEGKSDIEIIAQQTWNNVWGFILLDTGASHVGLNSRYIPPGHGMLDRLTAILFWLGLMVSVVRWRQALLWWVFFLVMIFPIQVLGSGTPDAARAVGTAPLFYLFVALALDWLLGLRYTRKQWVFKTATIAVLVLIAYLNVSSYFDWMERPDAAAVRQPAVDVADFESWQILQKAAAEAGQGGFNVGEWLEMKERGF